MFFIFLWGFALFPQFLYGEKYEEIFAVPYPERNLKMISYFEQIILNPNKTPKNISNVEMEKIAKDFKSEAQKYKDEKAILYADCLPVFIQMREGKMQESEVLSFYQNKLKKAQKLNYPYLEATLHTNLAFYYGIQKRYALYFYYLLKGYDIYKYLESLEFPGKKYSIYQLALSYYKFGDNENALNFAKVAHNIVDENRENLIFVNDLVGAIYLKKTQYDSSLVYFSKTLVYAQTFQDSIWMGIALGKIGQAYFGKNDTESALFYLEKGVNICEKHEIFDNSSVFLLEMIRIYLKQKNLSAVELLCKRTKFSVEKAKDEKTFYDYFILLAQYHAAKKDFQKAYQFQDAAFEWSQKLAQTINFHQKTQLEIEYEKERRFILQKSAEQKSRNTFLIQLSIIFLLIFALVLAYFIYQKKKLESKQKLQHLHYEKEKTAKDLEYAQIQLDAFVATIHEKNALIESLQNTITDSLDSSENPTGKIVELKQFTILTEEDWQRFSQLFDKVYPHYLYSIKETYKGITPAEIRYLALSKLNLSNKEMANMLGVGESAIRSIKSRLVKKIDV